MSPQEEDLESQAASEPLENGASTAAKSGTASGQLSEGPQVDPVQLPQLAFARAEPTGGPAITVGWTPSSVYNSYQLEWKLVSETEWTHSDASSSLTVVVVTKGNLIPDGAYHFRVRGRSFIGEWGPFSAVSATVQPNEAPPEKPTQQPAAPPRPASEVGASAPPQVSGQPDMPQRAATTVSPAPPPIKSASKALSTKLSSEQAPRSAASCASSAPLSSLGLSKETVDGVLLDQKQAILVDHERELADREKRFEFQLEAVQTEAKEWKTKFLDITGTQMQALIDAKEEAHRQVVAEAAKEEIAMIKTNEATKATEATIVETEKELLAAEQELSSIRTEVAKYDDLITRAGEGAREDVQKETKEKITFIMRKAAVELRDQLQSIEDRAKAVTARKLAAVTKELEAKAEAKLRTALHEMEQAHVRRLQVLKNQAGATSNQLIRKVREQQDAKIAEAIRVAKEEATAAAKKKRSAAVELARTEAISETEADLEAHLLKLEQQVARAYELLEERSSERERNNSRMREQLEQLQDQSAIDVDAAVEKAIKEETERSLLQMEQMREAIGRKVQDGVERRQQELVAKHKAAMIEQQGASRAASRKSDATLNDAEVPDEEEILARTQPLSMEDEQKKQEVQHLLQHRSNGDDDSTSTISAFSFTVPAHSVPKVASARFRKSAQAELAAASSGANLGPSLQRPGLMASDDDMPLTKEEIRLRERHSAETKAMHTRHEADELMMEGVSSSGLEKRRLAELEKLRERQLEEAFVIGASIVYQEHLKYAPAPPDDSPLVDSELKLLTYQETAPESEDELQQVLARRFPELRNALERVKDVEAQLESLSRPQQELEKKLALEKEQHQRTTEQLIGLLRAKREPEQQLDGPSQIPQAQQPLAPEPISEELRNSIRTNFEDLMAVQDEQDQAMEALLAEVTPENGDGKIAEISRQLQQELHKDEAVRQEYAAAFKKLTNSESLDLESLAQVRALMGRMQDKQAEIKARKTRMDCLHAESRRVRLVRLHEAKRKLEALQAEALINLPAPHLEIPCAPVAAAEDETSICVDWLPPAASNVTMYHLQWRAIGTPDWESSEASERLTVPCCTKGRLLLSTPYEFRVRAYSADGTWGGFTKASEPATPSSTLSSIPSRPVAVAVGRGCLEVKWAGPAAYSSAMRHEVQWRKVNARSWEGAESCVVTNANHTTSSLHQGSVYTFRVRSMIQGYTGPTWTGFSAASPPVRPMSQDPAAPEAMGPRAANLAEAKRHMQYLGKSFAESRSQVSWPAADPAEAEEGEDSEPRVLPPRRRNRDDGSTVSTSKWTPSEVGLEAQVRAAAAACHPSVRSEVNAEIQSLDELRQHDEQLIRLKQQHQEGHEEQLKQLQDVEETLLKHQERAEGYVHLQDVAPVGRDKPITAAAAGYAWSEATEQQAPSQVSVRSLRYNAINGDTNHRKEQITPPAACNGSEASLTVRPARPQTSSVKGYADTLD